MNTDPDRQQCDCDMCRQFRFEAEAAEMVFGLAPQQQSAAASQREAGQAVVVTDRTDRKP